MYINEGKKDCEGKGGQRRPLKKQNMRMGKTLIAQLRQYMKKGRDRGKRLLRGGSIIKVGKDGEKEEKSYIAKLLQ